MVTFKVILLDYFVLKKFNIIFTNVNVNDKNLIFMPTILLNNIRPGGKSLTNLRVGSTEVKYVKRGDGKLFYDILSYYSYGTPSVNLSYPSGNTSAAGGTKSPTLSYS